MEIKTEEWVINCLKGNASCLRKENLNKIAAWLENEKAELCRLRLQNGDSDSYVNDYAESVVNAEANIARILNE